MPEKSKDEEKDARTPAEKRADTIAAKEEAAAAEVQAQVEAEVVAELTQSSPGPVAILAGADDGYVQEGTWSGLPVYKTTFDNFTTTDEEAMKEYVAGARRRAPTPGQLTAAQNDFEERQKNRPQG